MRVICLDIGEKRIGVAVSDLLDLTAQGVETIWVKGVQKDCARIEEICTQYETKRILCGLPLNMDGSEGFQAERVKRLANELAARGYEIRYQDERLTTKMATSVLLQADVSRSKRKEVVDKLAATYILQSFLDSGGWKNAATGKEHKKVFQSEVWYMSENMNNQDMQLDPENIVELVDDEGNSVVFEHLMTLEHNGGVYICLAPAEPMEDVAEDELADDGASNAQVAKVREYAAAQGSEVFVICAQIEQEIAELDDDEKAMFLEDLGLKESGLEKLIRASYHLLGLISYLTAGKQETRAWTITRGTEAPQAAGKIHSDFERGFIRAEVVNYQDLLDCGSYSAAKDKGLVGLEGKEYVVKDGDVILFRFNV